MPDLTWTPCTVSIGSLKPWANNPRLSTKAQAKRILRSFARFGQVQTIAIGPENEVYDGHQRLSALLTIHGPDYPIDARRSSRALAEDERRELVVTLHSGAVGAWDWDDLAGWDAPKLQEWGLDASALKQWRADAETLVTMLKSEKPAPGDDPGADFDRAEELRQKWGVESGQMWALGAHKIICGDCTDGATMDTVMGGERYEMVFTDPPYGVSIGQKNRFLNSIARSNRIEKDMENDTIPEPELSALLQRAFDLAIQHGAAGAAWYVASPAGPLHVLFGLILTERGILRQTIQWVKNNATLAPLGVDYHWRAEPICYGWLPNGAHRYYGGRDQDTVWNIDRPHKSPEHPTMKPVELVARAIENSSRGGEIVLDMFSGSGTTIVACELLGRRCRAIEISPGYVAVALERWATMTGCAPVLLDY